MTNRPYPVQKMLRTYSKQLLTARRLARLRRSLNAAKGVLDDPDLKREKRRVMVERVAREVMDDLLVIGSENPLVEEVRQELEMEFQANFTFYYPPLEDELQIFRMMGGEEPQEIQGEHKQRILGRLWEITLSKVNKTTV